MFALPDDISFPWEGGGGGFRGRRRRLAKENNFYAQFFLNKTANTRLFIIFFSVFFVRHVVTRREINDKYVFANVIGEYTQLNELGTFG